MSAQNNTTPIIGLSKELSLGQIEATKPSATFVDCQNDCQAPLKSEINEQIGLLYRKYRRPVLTFISKHCNQNIEIAEEVVQETFIALAKHLHNGGRIVHERGLIHKIAKMKLIDHYRRDVVRMKNAHDEITDYEQCSDAPSHERRVDAQERLAKLEQIIHTLPKRCKEIFILRAFEEMKYEEIAVHCGISRSMVEKHLSKAYKILREKMAP